MLDEITERPGKPHETSRKVKTYDETSGDPKRCIVKISSQSIDRQTSTYHSPGDAVARGGRLAPHAPGGEECEARDETSCFINNAIPKPEHAIV